MAPPNRHFVRWRLQPLRLRTDPNILGRAWEGWVTCLSSVVWGATFVASWEEGTKWMMIYIYIYIIYNICIYIYIYIHAASQQCVCIPLLNPQLRTFAELVGRIWEAYLEITWRFKWRWSNELSELDLIHPMAIWSFQQACETLRNHRGGRHCPLILWFIGVVRGSRNLRSVRNLGPKIALDWLWISIRNLTWNR